MIFGSINAIANYKGLEKISESLKWLQNIPNDSFEDYLNSYEQLMPGGSAKYACYTTKPESDCVYESHKKYIDVHYLLEGSETIKVQKESQLNVTVPYDESGDCTLFSGECEADVIMLCGSFLVLYPTEAHKVGANTNNQNSNLRKIILKIPY